MGIARGAFVLGLALAALPAAAAAQTVVAQETFDAAGACGVACMAPCVIGATGFVNATGDGADWSLDTFGTTTLDTGPPGDHTTGTGTYLYLESSDACVGGTVADLEWRDVDLSTVTLPILELYVHMRGNDMGTLAIEVDPDGTAGPMAFGPLLAPFTDNSDVWTRRRVYLGAFAGATVSFRFRGTTGAGPLSDMAIDDVAILEAAPDDIGVLSVDSPASGCGLGPSEAIGVTLVNLGSNAQSGFSVELTVDGATPVTETFTGTLMPAASASFTFAAPVDLSGVGLHTISARTALAADTVPANDASARELLTPPGGVVATFPSVDDFEAGPGQWQALGAGSFVRGTPSFGAYSGRAAWATGLAAEYGILEDSAVTSVCGFDLSGLVDPHVRMRIRRLSIQTSYDGARLEASTDGGATWSPVGSQSSGGLGWYNDRDVDALDAPRDGWSDSGIAWEQVAHPLTGLAGMSAVMLRVRFASDGSVTGPGFGFDDVEVYDNARRLEVRRDAVPDPFAAVPAGTVRHLALRFLASADGDSDSVLTGVTITRSGSLPDAALPFAVLWQDTGDGRFDPMVDRLLAAAPNVGGQYVFTTMGPITIPVLSRETFYATLDLDAAATAGQTAALEINAATDVSVSSTSPVVIPGPIAGPSLAVAGPAALPFSDDFEGPRGARGVTSAPGPYPTAAAAGGSIGSVTSFNDARVGYAESVQAADGSGGRVAVGPNGGARMGAVGFGGGAAVGAIDYRVDASALTVADNRVWVRFAWNATGEEDDDADGVFVSLDGGASWAAALLRFPLSTPRVPGWTEETIELSAALAAAGQDFTSDVLLRFQARGDEGLGDDGLLVDDVWIGQPQWATVERVPAGVAIAGDGTDTVMLPVGEPSTLEYAITNAGDLPLSLTAGSFVAENATNASGLAVTPPGDLTLDPGETTTFTVSLTVDSEAPLAFDVRFDSDDPRLAAGRFAFAVRGDGVVPLLDVQRPAGASIALMGTDDAGTVTVGAPVTLTYAAANPGGARLRWGSATPVAVANETNVAVTVTQPAEDGVDPGASATYELIVAPDAEGAFSFEVTIMADGIMAFTYSVTGRAAPMPVDAGPPASDGGAPRDAGGVSEPMDGCGCRAVGQRLPRGAFWWFAIALLLVTRRRPRA